MRTQRETSVELREENPKTSQNDLIIFLRLRGSMSALSFPKLPGDVAKRLD